MSIKEKCIKLIAQHNNKCKCMTCKHTRIKLLKLVSIAEHIGYLQEAYLILKSNKQGVKT